MKRAIVVLRILLLPVVYYASDWLGFRGAPWQTVLTVLVMMLLVPSVRTISEAFGVKAARLTYGIYALVACVMVALGGFAVSVASTQRMMIFGGVAAVIGLVGAVMALREAMKPEPRV